MDNVPKNMTTMNDDKFLREDLNTYLETPWTLIESYFEGHYLEQLVRHQLESYNLFVNVQIQKTIDMFNPVHICSDQDYDEKTKKHSLEMFISFANFQIHRPQIHENNNANKLMFPKKTKIKKNN